MIRTTLAAIGATALLTMAAQAAPLAPQTPHAGTGLVEKTQGYRRDCVWINNGWNYRRGGGYVACRPYSPGRGWVWHREGNRFGWWNPKTRGWHHRDWH
jgi:hypothetical protein